MIAFHGVLARRLGPVALVVAAGAILGCRTPQSPGSEPPKAAPTIARTETPTPVNAIAPPWTLHVADGSGNVYYCEHAANGAARFEYRPVRPENSSTGTYSGGDPKSGPLAPEQVEALWRQVEAAVARTADHVANRDKGTVAIDAHGPTTGNVILSGKAGAELIATLAALRGQATAEAP